MPTNRNLDWVADPSSKIFPIKHDAFNHVLGLGKIDTNSNLYMYVFDYLHLPYMDSMQARESSEWFF